MKSFEFLQTLRFSVMLCLFFCFPVFAEPKKAVTEQTFKILKQSDAWLRQGKAKQAVRQLQSVQSSIKNKPFEAAVIQQYLAYAHAEAGNLWAARQAAKSALDSKLLAADAVHGLHYLVGQIALRQEDFQQSAVFLEQWLEHETKVDPEICYMAGYAAYRAHRTSATRLLEQAIAAKKTPDQAWIQLLLSLYIDRRQYSKAEPMVKKLIALAPNNKEWWRYLSNLYQQQNRHDLALSSMMLAYYNGVASSKDILQSIGLNARQGYPVKAARMLKKELDEGRMPRTYQNLKLLYRCWQLARDWDNARRVLAEAAKFAPDGEDFTLLGRLEMRQGNWSRAKNSLLKGLGKGSLKHRARSRLWLGIAALKANDEALARSSLQALLGDPKVQQEAAYWLKQLNRSNQSEKTSNQVIPKS